MNDQDLEKFNEALKSHLREAGLAELADDESYLHEDPETGERRRPPPRVQAKEMLVALEIRLALADQRIVEKSLALIREVSTPVDGIAVTDAVVVPTPGRDESSQFEQARGSAQSMRERSDLTAKRNEVKKLISQIRDEDDLSSTEE